MEKPSIIGFDSWEAAQSFMAEAEERANSELLPEQKTIGYGDYWFQKAYGDFIFGRIWTQVEHEMSYSDLHISDGPEAAESCKEMDLNAHERGYRFGKAHSVMCPEGELGSTHIANMTPMSKEIFDAMRALKWHVETLTTSKLWKELT
jgi:hypothetical protein